MGQFNGSYVGEFIEQYQVQEVNRSIKVVPYTSLAPAYNLVSNPIYSVSSEPVNCTGNDCESYLLTGGLALARPWVPTNYTQDPVIVINGILGTQIDFQPGLDPGEVLEDTDCDVFYQELYLIAIRFCVTQSRTRQGSYIAGQLEVENQEKACITYLDRLICMQQWDSQWGMLLGPIYAKFDHNIFDLQSPIEYCRRSVELQYPFCRRTDSRSSQHVSRHDSIPAGSALAP